MESQSQPADIIIIIIIICKNYYCLDVNPLYFLVYLNLFLFLLFSRPSDTPINKELNQIELNYVRRL